MENVKKDLRKDFLERPRIYKDQLLTVGDLDDFKRQLLFEIKMLLKEQAGQAPRKWLKSHEVRKLLKISPGTLQTLRARGTIPYTKINGTIFYDSDDITKMLETNKIQMPGQLDE
jgi:hypothetical protein